MDEMAACSINIETETWRRPGASLSDREERGESVWWLAFQTGRRECVCGGSEGDQNR